MWTNQTFEGRLWTGNFNDMGEYDVIVRNENYIALELGERPRFWHA